MKKVNGFRPGREARPSPLQAAIERAAVARWRKEVETDYRAVLDVAAIRALQSNDSKAMVEAAGRVLYVVLGAAMQEGASDEDEAMLPIIDAVNAVFDQAGVDEITVGTRLRVHAGLDAAVAALEVLDFDAVVDAACMLEVKLSKQHIGIDDFRALVVAGPTRKPE